MSNKFTINFNNPSSGAATSKHSFPLGETMLSVAAPTCVSVYDDNSPYPKSLYDPYKTYITIAFPPSTWRNLCKDDGPSIGYQTRKIMDTIQTMFSKNKLQLDFYYTLELNTNHEYLHLHGVISNKKNMNQLVKFKKLIRDSFHIPATNRVAIKTYSQSSLKTEQDQLNYHLKSISYDGHKKDRMVPNFYHVSGNEANVR